MFGLDNLENRLIVGLGNPGVRYEATRHNVGFMTLDALMPDLACEATQYSRIRCEALVYEFTTKTGRIILAKPQTFMNHSGQSVKGLLKHYHVRAEELIVVHDDLDLPVGVLRIKTGGGCGGHRGVRSIIDSCTEGFIRVKVGIGRPPGEIPPEDYVLQIMHTTALEELKVDAARAAGVVGAILKDGVLAAQNTFNAEG